MDELERAKEIAIDVLVTEACAGLLFLGLAKSAKDLETRRKNIDNARKALATIDYFVGRLRQSAAQAEFVLAGRNRLHERIQGEEPGSFPAERSDAA